MRANPSSALPSSSYPPPSSSLSMAPFPRTLHPAVILDAALMVRNPVSTGGGGGTGAVGGVVLEIPVDAKGRPYPYVLPPCFPGGYPTIAFTGTAEQKQMEQGLHPLMRVKVWT